MNDSTPYAYARSLANYIADPSTIRTRTIELFGRAPPVDICARMRAEATAPPKRGNAHAGVFS